MFGPMTMMLIYIVIVLLIAYGLVSLIPKPAVFNTVIWVVAAIICLVLLMRGLGIAMP